MELINKFLTVCEALGRLPAVVAFAVPFPAYQILKLVAIGTTIEDLLHFVFQFTLHLDWFWWGWLFSVDFVTLPGCKAVDMDHVVSIHGRRKGKAVREVTGPFEDFIGT